MLSKEIVEKQNLYETDYHLWVIETVKKLEMRDFANIDWENLIEEVSDLSRREKRRVESLLIRLFEHLLKLKYWESEVEANRGHWEAEILNFRKQIKKELKASPSLKRYLVEIWEEAYQDGREIAAKRSQLALETFPENAIASLDQVLSENEELL